MEPVKNIDFHKDLGSETRSSEFSGLRMRDARGGRLRPDAPCHCGAPWHLPKGRCRGPPCAWEKGGSPPRATNVCCHCDHPERPSVQESESSGRIPSGLCNTGPGASAGPRGQWRSLEGSRKDACVLHKHGSILSSTVSWIWGRRS